jgi:hypothetical protein
MSSARSRSAAGRSRVAEREGDVPLFDEGQELVGQPRPPPLLGAARSPNRYSVGSPGLDDHLVVPLELELFCRPDLSRAGECVVLG